MRRFVRALSIVGCVLVVCCMVSSARADLASDFWNKVWSEDNGVDKGDPIRIVFVTSPTIDGMSDSYDYYDSFGDSYAASGVITGDDSMTWMGKSPEWRPLVSVSGGGNTVETWMEQTTFDEIEYLDLPVFNTKGELVANSGAAMLMENDVSANLFAPIQYDESGDDQVAGDSLAVWTGTRGDGTVGNYDVLAIPIDLALGSVGDPNKIGDASVVGDAGSLELGSWLANNTEQHQLADLDFGDEPIGTDLPPGMTVVGGRLVSESPRPAVMHSIYVMSSPVPEPSTVLLWLAFSGLAGLIYWRKRRS